MSLEKSDLIDILKKVNALDTEIDGKKAYCDDYNIGRLLDLMSKNVMQIRYNINHIELIEPRLDRNEGDQ